MKSENSRKWKFILGGVFVVVIAVLVGWAVYRNGNYWNVRVHNQWGGTVLVETDYYTITLPASWRNRFRIEIGDSEEVYGGRDTSKIYRYNYRMVVRMHEDGLDAEIGTVEMYTYPQDAHDLTSRWDKAGQMTVKMGMSTYNYVYLLVVYPDDTLAGEAGARREQMQAELLDAVEHLDKVYEDGLGAFTYMSSWHGDCSWDEYYERQEEKAREQAAQERRERIEKARQERLCGVSSCSNNKVTGGYYCYEHTCRKSGCYGLAVSKGYCYQHKSGSSSGSPGKKHSGNYDSYYEDDPEAYYEDNRDLYDSFEEAMDDWEDEYGDDY